MVTLKTFTRSLEPITVFDDGGLSDFGAVSGSELVGFRMPGHVRSYEDDVTNVVLNGFLWLLCDQCTSLDAQNKNKLFQLVSSELKKHVKMRPISNASIQLQVRNGLSRLLQAGVNLLSEHNIRVTRGQDLAPFMEIRSVDSRSVIRFQQPLSSSRLSVQPSLSIVDCIRVSSKLADEFEDIKPLAEGRGAFGKVYTARKKSDDIIYAIKKIKIAADDRYATGMHREVESLSRLSHPNIVRYYDSWQEVEFEQQESDVDSEDESESSRCSSRPKGNDYSALKCYLYIHMELCEMTLKCWLAERLDQAADYDKSYEIAKQILEGIVYMHSKNWFHRDLKPLNIFLSGDSPTTVPNIKIGDFGLARQTSSDSYKRGSSPQVNEFTAEVGTAMYGAPEQLNGSAYSMESDMFSVGLILYELYYLFKTDTEKMKSFDNLRKGKMDEEFESSRPVEAVIIRLLTAKDPSMRPSAGDVLDMLGSRRGRDNIANADIVCSIQSMSGELSELKRQLHDKDVQLSKKDELLTQKDAQILALQRRIAEFETQHPL